MNQDKKDTFAIAKEALRLTGEFGTPPTPEVYEVWFRFVEGADEELLNQMNHVVHEAKAVSESFLNAIHNQYCSNTDDTQGNVGDALSSEMDKFQSLLTKQQQAGTEFEGSIEAASGVLSNEAQSPAEIVDCISALSKGTEKMQGQLKEMEVQLTESQMQIANLKKDLEDSQRSVMTDHLTGVGNRRYFDTIMNRMFASIDQNAGNHFLVLIDMDRLKKINDTLGHDAGDQLICFVASQIAKRYPQNSLARLGGDEFACFVKDTDREQVEQFTDDLRNHFANQHLKLRQSQQSVGTLTFSIGAARLRKSDDATTWYTRADSLLYQAKDLGRNRAVVEKVAD